jgi:hypothetical protein
MYYMAALSYTLISGVIFGNFRNYWVEIFWDLLITCNGLKLLRSGAIVNIWRIISAFNYKSTRSKGITQTLTKMLHWFQSFQASQLSSFIYITNNTNPFNWSPKFKQKLLDKLFKPTKCYNLCFNETLILVNQIDMVLDITCLFIWSYVTPPQHI